MNTRPGMTCRHPGDLSAAPSGTLRQPLGAFLLALSSLALMALSGLALMALSGLALMALSGPALAFDPDSGEPITVSADNARLDEKAGQAIYRGDVVVTQGETRLEADQIVLTRGDEGLDVMEATGDPARYQQPARNDEPALEAEAQLIHYERELNRIRFLRDALIRQSGDSFRGERIDYDIIERVVTASGGEESTGRVEMTLQPRRESSGEQE